MAGDLEEEDSEEGISGVKRGEGRVRGAGIGGEIVGPKCKQKVAFKPSEGEKESEGEFGKEIEGKKDQKGGDGIGGMDERLESDQEESPKFYRFPSHKALQEDEKEDRDELEPSSNDIGSENARLPPRSLVRSDSQLDHLSYPSVDHPDKFPVRIEENKEDYARVDDPSEEEFFFESVFHDGQQMSIPQDESSGSLDYKINYYRGIFILKLI